jgi:hypothetical protein
MAKEMPHLNDLTLNAYLDFDLDLATRREADSHLAACPQCVSRLDTLQTLFDSLETLPELALETDLSARVVAALQPKRTPLSQPTLSPTARLAFALQAVGALVAVAIALPFAMQLATTFDLNSTQSVQLPTANFQSLLSTLQSLIPAFDPNQFTTFTTQLPTFEITTLILCVVALTTLWFVGNGLLLRLNSPNSQTKYLH